MSEDQEQEPMSEAAKLRARLDELVAGNGELKATVAAKEWQHALRAAGFEPDSAQAKALTKTFDARDAVTPDAILAHAEGLGFSPTPVMSDDEIRAQMRAEGEQRLSMVLSGAMPSRDPSQTDEFNAALADGDIATAGRINAQILERARRGGREYGGGRGY